MSARRGFDGDAATRAAEERLLETRDVEGAWEQLLSVWKRAPELAGEYAEARENPGLNPDKARFKPRLLRALDRCLEKDPRRAPALAWRGVLRRQLLDYPGAVSDLDRAWTLGLRSAATLTWRGEARLQTLDLKGGLADMKAALRRSDAEAWNWAWCGRALLNQFRDLSGIRHLDRAIRLAPRWAKAYVWRGEARRHRGPLKGMLADFDSALRLEPDDSLRHFARGLRGLGLLQLGRLDEAARELAAARRAAPDRSLWVHGLSVAARKAGRLGDWIALLDEANRIDIKYEKQLAAYSPADRERLLRDLDSAVAAAPRGAARRWRGRALLAGGRHEEAEADFAAACRSEPKNAAAWLGHCESLLGQRGRLREAVRSLKRAARLDGRNPEIALTAARAALAAGNAAAALSSYRRALKLDPRSRQGNAELGAVLLSLGRTRAALEPLDTAVLTGGGDVFPLVDLSVARRRAGDRPGAGDAWRRALELDPAKARERLQLWKEK